MVRTLGTKGTKLIHTLAKENNLLFSIKDAMKITRSTYKTTEELIRHLLNKNWLMSIKNGKYAILPLEAGMENVNPYNWFVIARELISPNPYYISYYSAMSIHNMITQPLRVVYIASPHRYRDKNIGTTRFKFVYTKEEKLWGISKEWVTHQEQVDVSNLERTIIDCLYIPEYCGGVSEIAKGIWITRNKIDYKKLYDYACRFNKNVIIKRLGFILENYEIDTENIIMLLNKRAQERNSYPLFDPMFPDEGEYIKKWRLKVNLKPSELKAIVRT